MVAPHPLRLVTLAVARELGTVREERELGAICGTLGLAPATARKPQKAKEAFLGHPMVSNRLGLC